ncbi:hypothetical protein JM18_008911 [Phytophthora kernoviae]|uniref:Uncharacterized protein n=2 Tax=Phytophthora kernoviae TaxID=325452 RepID=A0A8T0LMC0_9STRA|nr:hypothetical protein G195_011589 [Phytophthora kernoviae 00238/432]KAG2507401.1 hypothetical protein JM18_008911 [Phytophthora kernoviae]KAG2508238.1 hypothetical protein JM16_008756 [Phytophthora kernoviae]
MFTNTKIFALYIAVVALLSSVYAEKEVAETFGLLGAGYPGVGIGVGVGVPGVAGVGIDVPGVTSVGVGVPGVASVGVGVPGVANVGVGVPAVGANSVGVGVGVPSAGVSDVGVGVGTGTNDYSSKTVTATTMNGDNTISVNNGDGVATAAKTSGVTSQKQAYRMLRSEA